MEISGFRISLVGPFVLYFLASLGAIFILWFFAQDFSQVNLLLKFVFGICVTAWILLITAVFGLLLKRFFPKKMHHVINVFQATALDVFAKLLCLILLPYRQTRLDPGPEDITANDVPILLIPGYLENSAVWIYHRYHYQRAGLKNIFTIDLGYPFSSIENYAEIVREKIKKIKALTGNHRIHLIGHSMGGIVAAYYTVHMAEQDGVEVKKFITLGSPFEGTVMSKFGIGKCTRQMSRSSSFLKELTRSLSKSKARCFCQASLVDLIVFPGLSAAPVSQGFSMIKIYDDLGHISFLFSDDVIKSDIKFLNNIHN